MFFSATASFLHPLFFVSLNSLIIYLGIDFTVRVKDMDGKNQYSRKGGVKSKS
jgi:hypothetical protein